MSAPADTVAKAPAAAAAPAPPPYDPVDSIPLPPRVFVPIPGAEGSLPPATRVNAGQPLMMPTGPAQIIPLAPAAGTVVRITEVERIGIGRTAALEIAVDPAASREAQVVQSPAPVDLAALIDALRRGGVQAERDTSPNLLAQLLDARERKIDTILCNLLDPAGESDLMATVTRSFGDAIVAGLTAIAKACGAARIWLAADTRAHTAAQTAVRAVAPAGTPRMRVFEIANDYPQANPSLLLYALLSRRLPPGRLPTEVGSIVLDGPAAAAVGRCIAAGQPVLDVPIEIRESEREACSVRLVPVGTPLSYLLEQLWLRPQRLTLRAGAALRDVRVPPDSIVDTAGELSIDVGPLSPVINPDPCIRCGWCVEACPVRIHPAGLLEAAQDHDYAAAQWYGLATCIECGVCSYVCPSRLPLLPAIRDLRAALARRVASPSPSGEGGTGRK